MLDQSINHVNGRVIYPTVESPPDRQFKNQILGKLKSMGELEFGVDKIEVKWSPSSVVNVTQGDSPKICFASLSPYGGGIVWGTAALTKLGWTEEQANQNSAAFSC